MLYFTTRAQIFCLTVLNFEKIFEKSFEFIIFVVF